VRLAAVRQHGRDRAAALGAAEHPVRPTHHQRKQRVEWEAEVRSLYDGMVRIVVTPTWVKLIDFETTLPSAVAELARQRDEYQRA
jgi:hypothetical protein